MDADEAPVLQLFTHGGPGRSVEPCHGRCHVLQAAASQECDRGERVSGRFRKVLNRKLEQGPHIAVAFLRVLLRCLGQQRTDLGRYLPSAELDDVRREQFQRQRMAARAVVDWCEHFGGQAALDALHAIDAQAIQEADQEQEGLRLTEFAKREGPCVEPRRRIPAGDQDPCAALRPAAGKTGVLGRAGCLALKLGRTDS